MGFVRAILLVALVVSAGCYRWVPHEGQPLAPGTEVRLRLTDAGTDDVSRRLGDTDGTVMGPMAFWHDDAVALTVSATVRRAGFPPTVITDTIEVASNYLAGVDVKELHRRNTILLAAGVAAGAAGLVFATRALGGENEQVEGGGPPIEEAVILRIPLGFGGR